jgi:Fe-S-cluster containining protein
MGEIIEIRDEIAPLEFHIMYTSTGEERTVRLDPDKKDLFLSQDITSILPMACPFLRQKAPGTVICTVHNSRPELCRQYSCFRILVLDPEGKRIGRVMDASRYFTTMDHPLRELWQQEIASREVPDEAAWEDHIDKVLTGAGYRVIR